MSTAERLRMNFAAQFTPNNAGFIYRAHDCAPGIAISASERDRFIADFERYVPTLRWVCNPWLVVPAMLILPPFVAHHAPLWVATVMFFAIILLPGGANGWAANAPSRALKGRPAVDKGLPSEVIRANEIKKLTWPRLTLNLLVAGVWLAPMIRGSQNDSLTGRLVFGAVNALALWVLLRDLFAKIAHWRRNRSAAPKRAGS